MSRDDDPTTREQLSAADELLADRATVGLDDEQAERLADLLGAAGQELEDETGFDGDVEGWERAAAAIDLALFDDPEAAVPDLLARRLQDDASAFFAGRAPGGGPVSAPSPGRSPTLAWTVAALCAAAALLLLLTRPGAPPPGGDGDGRGATVAEGASGAGADDVAGADPANPKDKGADDTESVEPSPAERRAALLERQDTVRLPWTATDDPAAKGATGDVVWNDVEQRGYMRIRGLEANDIEALQYQLWIFDPARDERYPVDGGVFDFPAGADEVVIPIDAKLAVADPNLFAITAEKPGGVVVSSRERIVLLAQAGS